MISSGSHVLVRRNIEQIFVELVQDALHLSYRDMTLVYVSIQPQFVTINIP